MSYPQISPDIVVDPSIGDLEDLWDRFEIFEAMHHSQRICNPMQESELEQLLDLLNPARSERWLDVACGSGELLIRAHERAPIHSVGLDLSPWMLQSAVRQAAARLLPDSQPTWTLIDASAWTPAQPLDVASCVGAEWIWHGMSQTVATLATLVRPGGLVAYGGPRLHSGCDPEWASAQFGRLDTIADVEKRLGDCGLEVVERIDPGEAGWRAYLERGRVDVDAWAMRHPGERAERWVAEQQEWVDQFETDREVVGWSVWVARQAV